MNLDYGEAKTVALRALSAALVAGLLTVLFEGGRTTLMATSELALSPPHGVLSTAGLAGGVVLIGCWLGRRRAPAVAVIIAAAVWTVSLALPLLLAPAHTAFALASGGGVALSLGKLVVLILLMRGIPAALQMRRLLTGRA